MESVDESSSQELLEENPLQEELDLPSIQISRRLSLIGTCLLLVFCVFVIRAALPLQLLNIVWQIQLSTSVVEYAPIALLGVILIALASFFDQGNEDLVRTQKLVAKLSLIVSVGFFLLLPLRVYHIFAFQQTIGNVQDRQISQGLFKVKKIKEALNQSTSREDLESRLKVIGAPPLPEPLRTKSLPDLKEGLLRSLNKVEKQFQQRKPTNSKEQELNSYLSNGKMVLSSLLYAAAFSAAGQRANSDENFLDEILLAFRSLFVKVEPASDSGLDYLDLLSEQENQDEQKQ
jgi:hypothetical protein